MDERIDGLYIHGVITSRTKVPVADGKMCVEYKVRYLDTDRQEQIVKVSEWDFNESECLSVGESADIKVYATARGGRIYYTMDKGRKKKGEEF